MDDQPKNHYRKSIRLPEYDYSTPGYYFVTIVTHHREEILGEVLDGKSLLSPYGIIVQKTWVELPFHFPNIVLDEFCIMPNHFHGIVQIKEDSQLGLKKRLPRFSDMIMAFKSFSARRANAMRHVSGSPFWQRNYFEHIIQDETGLENIREYIVSNPDQWEQDEYSR